MSYVNANTRPVGQARLCLPLTGAWHADLYVQGSDALTGACTVDLGGALDLVGTVITGGVYVETAHVRVLAGRGGWIAPLTPKFYQGATLGAILADLLRMGGETLASSSNASARSVVLSTFSATSATLGANVRSLMAYAPAGTSWRFLADGTFWVGPETWPEFDEDYQVTGEQPRERRAEVGFQVPTLLPGESIVLSGGSTVNVNHVETEISAERFKARAWWQS